MKYVFFDIDSTLVSHVNGAHIPDATREAIRLLRLNGHVPAIATGRGGFLSQITAREFGIDMLVCSGGAEIFHNGKRIFTRYLCDDVVNEFVMIARKFPEVSAALDEKYLYTDIKFEDFREYFNSQAGYDCFRPLRDLRRAIICYIMLPPEKIDSAYGFFFAGNFDSRITLELMRNFVEARAFNMTKWRGIEFALEHAGGKVSDVITFGDGANDVDMLRNAPIGVAVKRSHELAREAADFVSEDIDDGGILKACRDLGLVKI